MSAQKEAALIAAKMTDASNLKAAGRQLVHAGKAAGQRVKMRCRPNACSARHQKGRRRGGGLLPVWMFSS